MSPKKLILATRRSALALAQARAFARALEVAVGDLTVEELHVVTTGDKVVDVPLSKVGGKGLFTKEIEQALAAKEAHFAVHSFKDVPAELADDFAIACVPKRADPRDVLVSRTGAGLDELPKGAKVGTSSLRRRIELSAARPDLAIVEMRGNVDTRLRKLDEGQFDAIVLARAGLDRLGLSARVTQNLDPGRCIPAAGQGALAIECRADDEATRAILATMRDEETSVAVACERGVMATVGGSCAVPFGAYARREGEDMVVRALLARASGERATRIERRFAWPGSEGQARAIGENVGRELAAAVG
jgi:hydroxymethylbilane synthase